MRRVYQSIAGFLALIMICSIGACSDKGSSSETVVDQTGTMQSSAAGGVTETQPENITEEDIVINQDALRYYSVLELEMPELLPEENVLFGGLVTTDTGFMVLFTYEKYNIDDYISTYRAFLCSYEEDGTLIGSTELEERGGYAVGMVVSFVEDPAGGYAALISRSSGHGHVLFFDEEGKQKEDVLDLGNLGDYSYPSSLYIADDDRILVGCYGSLKEYDRTGTCVSTTQSDSIEGDFFVVEDKLYISGYDFITQSVSSMCVFEVLPSGDISDKPADFKVPEGNCVAYDGELFTSSPEFYYKINLETGVPEPILMWSRTDLVTARSINSLYPISDESYICTQIEYNVNRFKISLLQRQPEDYLEGRTILTLAGVSVMEDGAIQQAIVDFNRENPSYRIELVDYAQRYCTADSQEDYLADNERMIRRIKMEILSGSGPDMVIANQTSDIEDYESSDLLVDLIPVMQQDASFDPNLFVSSVWNAAQSDGAMYRMPLAFGIDCLVASKDFIGEQQGLTFAEFDQMVAGLPDGTSCFRMYMTQTQLLKNAFAYSSADLIDEKNAVVNLNGEAFGDLLSFAKTYGTPEEMLQSDSFQMVAQDPESLLLTGELVFADPYSLSNPWIYTDMDNHIGTSGVTCCGYPSASETGPMANPFLTVAIVDKQEISEGCWMFLCSLLSEKTQRELVETEYGDSISKLPMLDSLLDEYLLLSEEPIEFAQTYFMQFGSEPTTPDQAAEFRALIDGVTSISSSNKEIEAIIVEEAAAFFTDQKSMEEVMEIIQDRVELYVLERQ